MLGKFETKVLKKFVKHEKKICEISLYIRISANRWKICVNYAQSIQLDMYDNNEIHYNAKSITKYFNPKTS